MTSPDPAEQLLRDIFEVQPDEPIVLAEGTTRSGLRYRIELNEDDECAVCEGEGVLLEYDPVVGRHLPWPCARCRQTGRA